MPQSNRLFTSKDIEILSHAVSIRPNLEYACYATKLAKGNLKFPINNYKDIAPLFKTRGMPDGILKRQLRLAHLRKFFPKQFFPIEDERDFLGKTFAALNWGDTVHAHERFVQKPERYSPVNYPGTK